MNVFFPDDFFLEGRAEVALEVFDALVNGRFPAHWRRR